MVTTRYLYRASPYPSTCPDILAGSHSFTYEEYSPIQVSIHLWRSAGKQYSLSIFRSTRTPFTCTSRHTVCPKKMNNRMQLEPQCTGFVTKHTAPDCASSGGPFFIGSLFVIMMYLRGYLVISEAT